MRELRADIDIDAPADRVWGILTDFPAYPEWNPFITSIAGDTTPGSTLEVRIAPPGANARTFKPRVLVAESGRELRWLGRLLMAGIFDGEHSLRIEPIDDARVHFVQSERFRGILVPLFGSTLEKTARGFTAMNEALKQRAER
jgi:hypothetical protein